MRGVILINKEKGYTSRDVVNVISKHFKTKKVGHTGTLDPMATGVLVVCIGAATKVVDLVTSYDKEYIAEVTLGITSDTLDLEGNITDIKDTNVNKEEIIEALNSMVGTYSQEVPSYSAVKIEGKKLYEYARKNVDIVLPKRQVTVKELELIEPINYLDGKTIFKIRTIVSKGTYIRSLVRDIATKLNTVGLMSNLVRTKQGKFQIEDTFTLEDIKNGNYKLYSIKDVLEDVKIVTISEVLREKILNGNSIEDIYGSKVLFVDEIGNEVALYHQENGLFKPDKMFKE